ncbi:MAG TPA: hypothetical protein PLS10_14455 [Chitinophagales bacterium]|nr:hypothetical protein [Chitinophagales bacterium]
MLNITTSPAIGSGKLDHLQIMRLCIEIENKLVGDQREICWISIKRALRSNPYRVVLKTVRDMAMDNHNAVADKLGIKLTDKILNQDL